MDATDGSSLAGAAGSFGGAVPPRGGDARPGQVRLRTARGGHRHPWVYRRMLERGSGELQSGQEVVVLAADGTPLGRGFYHGASQIAVRILSRDGSEALDERFFRRRLRDAVALRRDVLGLERETDAWRVVHGEGDGLSGLVVDRYAGLLVMQFYSRALFDRRRLLERLLLELFPGARVRTRVDTTASRHEGMVLPPDEQAAAAGEEVEIREGKMRFLVHGTGHKTGFFLDQRENRRRFASMVRGKKVLDAFSYTGALAIAAQTLGKARRVVALDLDEEAVAQGRRNALLNHAPIEWVHQDAFEFLRHQRHAAEPFEAIVLDPPKWATRRDRLQEAERRYLDINAYACRAIAPGGLLFSSSCSGLVSEEAFLRILRRAAAVAGREMQLLHVGGAAPDHPVMAECPESRYLKAVFARVL